ncbi:MAG: hypothetical protein JSV78_06870 [Phycisphaerales bacterium]|nr:MAG: hypothetical protein JSV78_06870 [Phycisphaerales bacterium]
MLRCTPMAALLVAYLCAGGCGAPKRSFQPEQDVDALNDAVFLHYVATLPVVTVDEGYRAVLMLADLPERPRTFEERGAALEKLGAVKPDWGLEADWVLDKGTLGYMLRTICDLPMGFNELWLSRMGIGDRRYALKTCVHEGLMPYAPAYEPVTGGELLAAVTKAETYIAIHGSDSP